MKIQTICFTLLISLFSESIAMDQNYSKEKRLIIEGEKTLEKTLTEEYNEFAKKIRTNFTKKFNTNVQDVNLTEDPKEFAEKLNTNDQKVKDKIFKFLTTINKSPKTILSDNNSDYSVHQLLIADELSSQKSSLQLNFNKNFLMSTQNFLDKSNLDKSNYIITFLRLAVTQKSQDDAFLLYKFFRCDLTLEPASIIGFNKDDKEKAEMKNILIKSFLLSLKAQKLRKPPKPILLIILSQVGLYPNTPFIKFNKDDKEKAEIYFNGYCTPFTMDFDPIKKNSDTSLCKTSKVDSDLFGTALCLKN